MFNSLKKYFSKSEIVPEVLMAYKWKLPDVLDAKIQKSENGGYWVEIKNLPGCFTQAENGRELFEMVNDAVFTYLDIPKEYVPFMPTFFPPEDIRKKFEIKIPPEFLQKNLMLQRN